ncbi:hypothetical protein ACWEP4_40445, partial [Streptomyces sp. NPDC004227]
MPRREHPTVRAPKVNQRERIQREETIDNLLGRALQGKLTIPEAAVLAEYWRDDRRKNAKTRKRLTDITRALQRHREAADAVIQGLEEQVAELLAERDAGPAAA